MEYLLLGLSALVLIFSMLGLHQVEEGHVAVYYRGGALLNTISLPGWHVQMPIATTHSQVQVTVQTDSVVNIPCGTSGGVVIHFDKVEVVNRLRADSVYNTIRNYTVNYDQTWIFDKIHHELNQFCSSHSLQQVYIDLFDTLDENLAAALQSSCNEWAPGIEIIAVRVTKPHIPDQIRRNYEEMEATRTQLLVATEEQKVVEKKAETERKRATIEAQKVADVSKIIMQKELQEKETMKKMKAIEDEILVNHEKTTADAAFYFATKEAEANAEKLTAEYLEFMRITSMANNTKVYFGEKIPSVYMEKN